MKIMSRNYLNSLKELQKHFNKLDEDSIDEEGNEYYKGAIYVYELMIFSEEYYIFAKRKRYKKGVYREWLKKKKEEIIYY